MWKLIEEKAAQNAQLAVSEHQSLFGGNITNGMYCDLLQDSMRTSINTLFQLPLMRN